MGDIFSNVVGTMLEPIRDLLYATIGRQFGYLVHCKKNVKDLEDEVNKLKVAMGSVQTRVDASLNNAEVIEDHVWRWLTDVQSSLPTLEEDNNILRQRTQHLKCLDVCTQYRLGKEGKKKMTDVTKLIEDGKFDSIAHRRPLTRTWHRTYSVKYESFESRDLVFKEIIEALKDDQCYKIGIHGMPGVGKTRMMKEVAQLAEKVGFFDEIAEIVVTQNPNLKEIQQKLAEGLNLDLDKKTEDARKGLLRDRLKNGKKILVMVDDIWNDKIKLEEIGIPARDDRTQGCKILLTSRRQDVCEAMAVEKVFSIGVLNEAEASSLFEKKVGNSFQIPGMRCVVEAVCKECAGLPLAILAVGGALKNKSKHVWEDALEQLRNACADNIGETTKELYSHIQLSYNYLQPDDAKLLFLLCCLFPEDAKISINDLLRYGFGMRLFRGADTMKKARNRAHSLVTILKASSLLLEDSKEESVKMHDIIRDVAISIASKERDLTFLVKDDVEKWPEEDEYKRCRAISLRLNDDCVLPNDPECPELRILKLEGRYREESKVPSTFFKGMEKLEVLHICGMGISTLRSSLKNLRMLYLYYCKLVNVAFLGELRKLEILIIVGYPDVVELAPKIGQLTLLRLLDVRYCYTLKIVPADVISSLSQLEELYIPDEFDQWEVKDNASLNELNSLKCLNSLEVHVPNVELLPLNELLFKSLIRFQISIGSKFHEIRSSAATRILKLVGFPLKKREQELKILMEKAEVLYLKLKGLKDVFDDRYGEGFQELEYLEVDDCDDEMEHLLGKPKGIHSESSQLCASGGSFSKLRELRVIDCRLMKYLFSAATARGLPQLQILYIYNCEMLEEIVGGDIEQEAVMDTIITFHQLERMKLKCLPNLRSFYGNTKKKMSTRGCNTSTLAQALFNDKVRFPTLEELKINDLESLTAIWDNEFFLDLNVEDSFPRLRNINVRNCQKLVNIIPPNVLPLLQGLEILIVSSVSIVEVIVSEEGSDDGIVVFPRLKTMTLEYLPNLKSFCWSRRGGEDMVQEENNIPQQQALFNHEVRFPTLEELKINDLESLTAIWDNELFLDLNVEDSFQRMRNINVRNCQKLVNIIPSNVLPLLQGLEILIVSRVSIVEVIVTEEGSDDGIVVFPRLKTMTLEYLPNLKSFCWSRRGGEDMVQEENNIPQQQALFNHEVRFPTLEELKINDLESLTAIWDNELFLDLNVEDSFQRMRNINVRNCQKLVNIIPSNVLPLLQGLEILIVSRVSIVEVIVTEEGSDDGIVVFPRLKTMTLEYLPNLKSFCWSRRGGEDMVQEENNIPQQQVLFNHEVAFLALEKLEIVELGSITAIWDDQLQSLLVKEAEDSFQRLMYMKVFKCEKLVNVIPSNMLPRLQNLEKLEVKECDSMLYEVEVVGAVEKGSSTTPTPTINVLPPLKQSLLSNLPNLVMYIRLNRLYAYSNLTDLHLSNRDSLGHVFSPSTARYLVHLEILEVGDCEKMEEIVAVERGQLGEEDVVHDDDIIVFPQLKHLQLWTLPNLKSFCCCTRGSKKQEETKEQKNISRVEALFNHKVRFPVLEELEINDLKSLTAIWDNELFLDLNVEDSFQRLRNINVRNCQKLVNIIPPNVLPLLQGLEILIVSRVSIVEVIVSEEGSDDGIVVFPRLKTMTLEYLPNLKSFCWSRRGGEDMVQEENNIPQQQALFNHEVRFPALEELKINDLESLTAIWDNELFLDLNVEDSFQWLRNINVRNCQKLVNIIPPNVLPLLQGLEILIVSRVSIVEVIVTEEGSDGIVVLPRLKTMILEYLPNLKSFCWSRRGGEDMVQEENNITQQQALFNHEVRFPALKELKIKELKSLTAIWDNQLLLRSGAQDSFRQIRLVNVEGCEKLVNVIPPNAIPILQMLESLEIVSCDSLISGVEVAAIEEGSDEILMFPQLKKLKLEELPKLSSLCCTRRGGEQKVVEESNNSQPQAFFNHKVEFPMLEELVCDGSIFEGIWLGHLETWSFSKVRVIEIKKYNHIVNSCMQLLQWFENVKEVRLESCYSLEVMFNLEGVDDAIQRRAIIVMSSQLQKLKLVDLPKLNHIWITNSGELLMFRNLTSLTVEKCNSLRYLFSLSIARHLTHLEELAIRFCDAMEEMVVKNEEQGKEEDSTDEIMFPKLWCLELESLPKLTSFCGANNAAFKFPSLKIVMQRNCQTFASRGISTPPHTTFFGDDWRQRHQQYVGKVKGLETVGNEDEGTS